MSVDKKTRFAAGEKVFRWTVLGMAEPLITAQNRKRIRYHCVCECGAEKLVLQQSLTKALTSEKEGSRSCGCLQIERATKHGFNMNGDPTPEYMAWISAKKRCYSPGNPSYEHYGARGIVMCDEWRDDFMAFMRDIGPRPSPGHSLDRINVNGNYEPGNCRWATLIEQARNKTTTNWYRYKGRTMTVGDIADELGLTWADVDYALEMGWIKADYLGVGQEAKDAA